MTLVLMVLTAFPLGFFVRNRVTALLAYVVAEQFLFTFQTAGLLLDWGGGDTAAFGGPFPDYSNEQYFGYGLVNLAILVVGIGLVLLGARLGRKRRARAGQVELAG